MAGWHDGEKLGSGAGAGGGGLRVVAVVLQEGPGFADGVPDGGATRERNSRRVPRLVGGLWLQHLEG
jgi:hypothetical protein